MKIIIILSLLYPVKVISSFTTLSDTERFKYIEEKKVKKNKKKSIQYLSKSSNSNFEKKYEEILRENARNTELIKRIVDRPVRKKSFGRIPALTTVQAKTSSAIIASNFDSESFYIRISKDSSYLPNAKGRCNAVVTLKRIGGICNLFVSNSGKEYFKTRVKFTDLDGTRGVKADKYWTNEGEKFIKGSVSTFLSTILESSKSRQQTVIGNVPVNSNSDMILSGASRVAENAANRALTEDKDVEIVIVYPERDILLHFEEGLDL